MRHRVDPWPAIADLFAALVVACFAGLIIVTGSHTSLINKIRNINKPDVRNHADAELKQVSKAVVFQGAELTDDGTDKLIVVRNAFESNSSRLKPEFEQLFSTACERYKKAIDSWPLEHKKHIELVIEGHTDSTQPQTEPDPRKSFLYNWALSSDRAQTVLYTFKKCGINPSEYEVSAAGFADTKPLCGTKDEVCLERNRRTTLRLRADTRSIEDWIANESDRTRSVSKK